MEFRNPQYNQNGTINCEVNHEKFGWIPYTASPNDVEPYGREVHATIIASGEPIAPYEPPSPEEAARFAAEETNPVMVALEQINARLDALERKA